MNIFEHPEVITATSLNVLKDQLVICNLCAVDKTGEFTRRGMAVGSSVDMRTHGGYEAKDFTGTTEVQKITATKRKFEIERHLDTTIEVTDREMVLDLDSLTEQYIEPATYALAEEVDTHMGKKLLEGAGLYVTPNLFATAADASQARKVSIIQQLKMRKWVLCNRDLEAEILGRDFFTENQIRGNDGITALQEAVMGRMMGMDFAASTNFPEFGHSAGTGVSVTNNSTDTKNQRGDLELVVAAITGSFNKDDRIQVAGLKRPLIVADDVAAGATLIPIVDPITEIILDGAAVTVIGAGLDYEIQGVIFDNQALNIAMPPLMLPTNSATAAVETYEGLSIRYTDQWNGEKKKDQASLDLLFGGFCADPRRLTLLGRVI